MRTVTEVIFGIYLLGLAMIDIRKKQVHIVPLIAGITFIPLFVLTENGPVVADHIWGAVPGMIFFVISFVSRGQVGLADAEVVLVMGICVGIGYIVSILAVSFITIAFTAMIMLAVKKLNRKSTLPYLPFICIGYVVSIWILRLS